MSGYLLLFAILFPFVIILWNVGIATLKIEVDDGDTIKIALFIAFAYILLMLCVIAGMFEISIGIKILKEII